MVLTIAGLVMLIGLLMFLLSEKDKIAQVGKIMFGVGLLCVLWNVGGVVNIFPAR